MSSDQVYQFLQGAGGVTSTVSAPHLPLSRRYVLLFSWIKYIPAGRGNAYDVGKFTTVSPPYGACGVILTVSVPHLDLFRRYASLSLNTRCFKYVPVGRNIPTCINDLYVRRQVYQFLPRRMRRNLDRFSASPSPLPTVCLALRRPDRSWFRQRAHAPPGTGAAELHR